MSAGDNRSRRHTTSQVRQTTTYLKELLQANGLRPRRQLGQNFLIDLNLLDLIVEAARFGADDVVLEIGGGTGGLTLRLAERAARVVTVELDQGFFKLLKKQVRELDHVALLNVDVLANKNRIEPQVLDALATAMRDAGADHYFLVANLPFDVASAVIGNLLLEELRVRAMCVTVQWEAGQRILARPGTKDYGPLSVLVNLVGSGSWVRSLAPSVFWPRPKVRSAIVRIEVHEEKRRDLDELKVFHRFVRDLFTHRRKNLRAAVLRIPGYKRLKGELDDVLRSVGCSHADRAEQLEPEKLRELFRALRVVTAVADSTIDE